MCKGRLEISLCVLVSCGWAGIDRVQKGFALSLSGTFAEMCLIVWYKL